MKWLARINGMISANIHDAFDRLENPDRQLRQAVREMEDALHRTIGRAVKAIAEEKLLKRQLAVHTEQTERWGEQAARAVQAGDESAARSALRRKFEQERTVAAVQEQLDLLRTSNRQLRSQVAEMRDNLHIARAKLATLIARHAAAKARRETQEASWTTTLDDGAFRTFQRMALRIERSEAEADALTELTSCQWRDGAAADEWDARVTLELEQLREQLRAEPIHQS